jgi:hypothetical protein
MEANFRMCELGKYKECCIWAKDYKRNDTPGHTLSFPLETRAFFKRHVIINKRAKTHIAPVTVPVATAALCFSMSDDEDACLIIDTSLVEEGRLVFEILVPVQDLL